MYNQLDEIVRAQKRGERRGIASICSAHPWVLKSAMQVDGLLLIESTCNQVNQYGGYTAMTPEDFVAFVHRMAKEESFPINHLILGGDHLGPSPWKDEPAASAMQKAEELVRACVQAGYVKIHLDASMRLGGDDPSRPLDMELSAQRTARLAKVAENSSPDQGQDCKLRYVVGTEVPPPGGAISQEVPTRVTKVEDVQRMLEVTRAAFFKAGLESAWERVLAIVVQPGVEFGDDFVLDYDPVAAHELAGFSETIPFVYEAHSTDYQMLNSLRNLVRDHFAILKVGPALTFAFRQAVFAIAMIENELVPPQQRSCLIEKLEEAMLRMPAYWITHYQGSEQVKAFARKYSLSDRIRYYWAQPEVQAAFELLLKNLAGIPLPLSLLSQYFPGLYRHVREGRLTNSVDMMITESISGVLRDYHHACEPAQG